MPVEGSHEPAAVILVAEAVPADSFPAAIGGVRILVKPVPAPEVR
jgi:hypothetical protein